MDCRKDGSRAPLPMTCQAFAGVVCCLNKITRRGAYLRVSSFEGQDLLSTLLNSLPLFHFSSLCRHGPTSCVAGCSLCFFCLFGVGSRHVFRARNGGNRRYPSTICLCTYQSSFLPALRPLGCKVSKKAEVKSGWATGPGRRVQKTIPCSQEVCTARKQSMTIARKCLFFARVEALCVQVLHKSPCSS